MAKRKTTKNQKAEKKVTRYTCDEIKEPHTPETGHTPLLPAVGEQSGVARQGNLFADLEKQLRESERSKRVDFYIHEEG